MNTHTISRTVAVFYNASDGLPAFTVSTGDGDDGKGYVEVARGLPQMAGLYAFPTVSIALAWAVDRFGFDNIADMLPMANAHEQRPIGAPEPYIILPLTNEEV